MSSIPVDYHVWQSIEYRPAIAELVPEVLRSYITAGWAALDVGCNTGNTALWLAQHGVSVLGIDINADALETWRRRASQAGLQAFAQFKLADITCDPLPSLFDVILLIRLLTCIPSQHTWSTVLSRVHASLRREGLLYVHDFLRDDGISQYHQRYKEAEALGWRPGNFAVNDPQGRLLFVAHHHTKKELDQIMEPYFQLDLAYPLSRSMSGNECRMFRFLGRKR